MRVEPRPRCPLCAGAGALKYEGLRDRLHDVPGSWSLRRCEDPACGCMWLDPCPVREDIGEAYAAYYTHRARSPEVERASELAWGLLARAHLGVPALLRLAPELRAELDLFLRHLPPPRPGMRLLDVGCGEGLALKVMEAVGWDVEGQDIDGQALAVSARRGLRVRAGTLHDCRYPDEAFDAVTMSHVLEHVHDPEALLREALRILRPGGVLVSVTPNIRAANHERFGASWLHLDPPRHLVLFSARALEDLARRAGFEAPRLSSSVRAIHTAEVAARHIQRNGRWAWGDRGTTADRLAGRLRLYVQLWRGDGESLRGDELILQARKA